MTSEACFSQICYKSEVYTCQATSGVTNGARNARTGRFRRLPACDKLGRGVAAVTTVGDGPMAGEQASDHQTRDGPRPFPAIRPARLTERSLTAAFAYWDRLRGDRDVPARAAVDPIDIPPGLLPNLMLTDVIQEGGRPRYRYRVVGSRIAELAGRDPTWEFVDETLPAAHGYRDYILALYDAIFAWRAPVYSHSSYVTSDPTHPPEREAQRLMLPLAEPDGPVSHVLSVQVFAVRHGAQQKPFLAADGYTQGDTAFVIPD